MASGIIYLIIIAMWAAYFLPQWLSSHEDASGKSIDRYKNAMQVVAENQSVTKMEDSLIDKSRVIFQRKLIFGSLFSLYLLSFVSALFGLLAWSTTFVPLTGFFIYLAHVRKQVVASQAKIRRIKAMEKIANAKLPTPLSAESSEEPKPSTEHWVPFADRTEITGVVVIPKDRTGWQPTQLPKPTYASAPKAIPTKRIIDLTSPGEWTAQQEQVSAIPDSRDQVFDQVAEEQLNDRAVNE
jgi:hypothetical protein